MVRMVEVGDKVRGNGKSAVETVAEVTNVYGPAVTTQEGNVYFLGQYEVVEQRVKEGAK